MKRSKCCEMVIPRAPVSATVSGGETRALLHSELFLCTDLRGSRLSLLPCGVLAYSALSLLSLLLPSPSICPSPYDLFVLGLCPPCVP